MKWISLVVYLVGAFADWYTVKRMLVDRAAQWKEGNPVLGWIMGHLGSRTGKAVTTGLVLLILLMTGMHWVVMLVLGILQLAAAAWNVWQLRKKG